MMLRLSKGLVTAAVHLYAMPIAGWLFLRLWHGELWPAVGFLNAAGALWFAPLLILLPIALLVRARQASFLSLLILIAAFAVYRGEFLPPLPRSVPEDAPTLRVLSYNAFIGNRSYDAVEAMIREEAPDVIAIQELSHGMAEALDGRLEEAYPYRFLYPQGHPRGKGIWSRYPLAEEPHLLHDDSTPWAQSAVVDWDGKPVYLLNVHLWPIGVLDRAQFAHALRMQRAQVNELHDLVGEMEVPTLVIGDFNASPTNATHRIMSGVARDAWREASFGPGFTWPGPGVMGRWSRPFLRIDYMWTRGTIAPLEMRVLSDSHGSDHMPLVGEFALVE